MNRTLISQTPEKIGEKVKINGWVNNRRDHGKITFIDIWDRSGSIQTVVIPDAKEAHGEAKEVRVGFALEIEGLVKERPGGARNEKITTGSVELEVEKIRIMSKPAVELPIDLGEADLNVQLETLLNHRTLTLRHEKVRAIFAIYAEIVRAYSDSLRASGFLEIKTPKILSQASEGGANFFKIKYFNQDAFLAQSPQFYKQAGVSIFERVFEVGPVFRAEPHYTSRHVNEYVSLDAEMGFIDGMEDVMKQLEKTLADVMQAVRENQQGALEKYEAEVPEVKIIPRMKLTEALEIMEREFGKKMETVDIDPEGEKLICDWVKKKYGSDFVFLTHYPSAIRPFYAMPSTDPQYTETFDLLFRGVEIATGGQRQHDYEELLSAIKKREMKPEDFKHYLDIFRYGIPPHGGWGLGSERIAQKILGLKNIKEAVLFPRDVKRIVP